jgi:hypothetical protein
MFDPINKKAHYSKIFAMLYGRKRLQIAKLLLAQALDREPLQYLKNRPGFVQKDWR